MKRYIDVSELPSFEVSCSDGKKYVLLPFERLSDIPAADVVEVVRCKDCEYGEVDDDDFPDQYFCNYEGDKWNDGNHFCSYGTPKDGGIEK